MDYSNLPGDVGAAPWGSNSPRADRTGFQTTPAEPPTSPFPTQPQSPYTPASTESQGQRYPAVSTDVSASAGDSSPDDDVRSPDLSEQLQSAQLGDPDYVGDHQPQIYQQVHYAAQQQPRPGQIKYQSNARPQRQVPQYKLQARITALERTGRKDPILRFDVHTNLPKFRTTQFRDVRRTHSEFVKLADHLISSNPEALVPAVPPSLTSAGAGTDEDEVRIKAGLQRWLNYVCSNDVLMRDDEMVYFVESDFGYSPVVRMKQPATGVRRKVIKQFAPPPDDTPELHEARPVVKLFYLGSLDAAQKLERMVKARRGLGLAESDLGMKIAQLHVQEIHPGLAKAYQKVGKIIQTAGDYHAAQGTAEATTFGDPLNYHSSDAFIVKETLTNRHILLRELLQAQQAARSRESAANRLKSSSSVRRDKVDEAISALDEALSNENYLKGKTSRVTANLLLEKRRWFQRTSTDMLASIRDYVLREIEGERRTLSTLESVRPDVRAIDASGGLSRLGRENNPAARRAHMAASQTSKGDAWSGAPRSGGLNRSISAGYVPGVPSAGEAEDEYTNGDSAEGGRSRSGTIKSSGGGSLGGLKEEDDEDRVDARNAASRLAQSTF
ncbi:MAG: hypothetical protein Q9227_004398 [Pyrenula ochraceoflavens]